MKTNLTISLILLTMCVFAHDVNAQSKDSTVEKGYYGHLDVSGGYIHKWMPGSTQSPYDFMLGASYVNGYRFSPHLAMGIGAGLNYYFDHEQITAPIYLHLNADILKRTGNGTKRSRSYRLDSCSRGIVSIFRIMADTKRIKQFA